MAALGLCVITLKDCFGSAGTQWYISVKKWLVHFPVLDNVHDWDTTFVLLQSRPIKSLISFELNTNPHKGLLYCIQKKAISPRMINFTVGKAAPVQAN